MVQKFAVVGVLENMEKSLTVLERYIPKYFDGATDAYFKEKYHNAGHSKDVDAEEQNNIITFTERKGIIMKNGNTFKPVNPITNTSRKFIADLLSREIDFYQFCLQRLNKQYLAIV